MNEFLKKCSYNIINVVIILILGAWQLFFFLLIAIMPSILLELFPLGLLILFSPLMYGWYIVGLNKRSLKRDIREAQRLQHAANNVHLDMEKDEGSIPKECWEAMPRIDGETEFEMWADTNAVGEIADLNVSYSLDYVYYDSTHSGGLFNTHFFKLPEYGLNFQYDTAYFCNEPIIWASKFSDIGKHTIVKQQNRLELDPDNKRVGTLYYNDVDDKRIENLIQVITKKPVLFEKADYPFVVFYQNRIIYFEKFHGGKKVKVPLLLTERRYQKVKADCSASIYKFNMLINELSTLQFEGGDDYEKHSK